MEDYLREELREEAALTHALVLKSAGNREEAAVAAGGSIRMFSHGDRQASMAALLAARVVFEFGGSLNAGLDASRAAVRAHSGGIRVSLGVGKEVAAMYQEEFKTTDLEELELEKDGRQREEDIERMDLDLDLDLDLRMNIKTDHEEDPFGLGLLLANREKEKSSLLNPRPSRYQLIGIIDTLLSQAMGKARLAAIKRNPSIEPRMLTPEQGFGNPKMGETEARKLFRGLFGVPESEFPTRHSEMEVDFGD